MIPILDIEFPEKRYFRALPGSLRWIKRSVRVRLIPVKETTPSMSEIEVHLLPRQDRGVRR